MSISSFQRPASYKSHSQNDSGLDESFDSNDNKGQGSRENNGNRNRDSAKSVTEQSRSRMRLREDSSQDRADRDYSDSGTDPKWSNLREYSSSADPDSKYDSEFSQNEASYEFEPSRESDYISDDQEQAIIEHLDGLDENRNPESRRNEVSEFSESTLTDTDVLSTHRENSESSVEYSNTNRYSGYIADEESSVSRNSDSSTEIDFPSGIFVFASEPNSGLHEKELKIEFSEIATEDREYKADEQSRGSRTDIRSEQNSLRSDVAQPRSDIEAEFSKDSIERGSVHVEEHHDGSENPVHLEDREEKVSYVIIEEEEKYDSNHEPLTEPISKPNVPGHANYTSKDVRKVVLGTDYTLKFDSWCQTHIGEDGTVVNMAQTDVFPGVGGMTAVTDVMLDAELLYVVKKTNQTIVETKKDLEDYKYFDRFLKKNSSVGLDEEEQKKYDELRSKYSSSGAAEQKITDNKRRNIVYKFYIVRCFAKAVTTTIKTVLEYTHIDKVATGIFLIAGGGYALVAIGYNGWQLKRYWKFALVQKERAAAVQDVLNDPAMAGKCDDLTKEGLRTLVGKHVERAWFDIRRAVHHAVFTFGGSVTVAVGGLVFTGTIGLAMATPVGWAIVGGGFLFAAGWGAYQGIKYWNHRKEKKALRKRVNDYQQQALQGNRDRNVEKELQLSVLGLSAKSVFHSFVSRLVTLREQDPANWHKHPMAQGLMRSAKIDEERLGYVLNIGPEKAVGVLMSLGVLA